MLGVLILIIIIISSIRKMTKNLSVRIKVKQIIIFLTEIVSYSKYIPKKCIFYGMVELSNIFLLF